MRDQPRDDAIRRGIYEDDPMLRFNKLTAALLLPAFAALPALGLGGCASGNTTRGNAENELASAEKAEFGTLSKEQVESFNRKLKQVAEYLATGRDKEAKGVEAGLAGEASGYEVALRAALSNSGDVARQGTAAFMLGYTKKPEYALPLAKLMTDESAHSAVRNRASIGLAAMGDAINLSPDRAAVMALIKKSMLPSLQSGSVRQHAVAAFGRAYSPEKGDTLTPLLDVVTKDYSNDVRVQGLVELREMGQLAADAVPELTVVIQDPNEEVRGAAAQALGRIPDARSLKALHEAMSDGSGRVRREAVYAIVGQHSVDPAVVRDNVQVGLADPDENVRRSATMAAHQMRDKGLIQALLPLLDDTSSNVRLETIAALGDIVPPEESNAAYKMVFSLDDGNAEIRSAAHSALKRITGENNLGSDREAWMPWFYQRYPTQLDPNVVWKDQFRPRQTYDSNRAGSGGAVTRPSTGRTTGRTTNNRNNNRNNTNNNRNNGNNGGWGGNNGGWNGGGNNGNNGGRRG
jgi:HEAT repeat protein